MRVTVDGKRHGSTLRHGHAAEAGARVGAPRCRSGRRRARAPGRRPLRAGLGPVPGHDLQARRDPRRPRGRAAVGAAAVRRRPRRRRPADALAGEGEADRAQPLRAARAPARRDGRLGLRRRAVPARPGPSTRCCSARRSSARPRWGSWCRRSASPTPRRRPITGSVVWGYIPGAKDATVSGAGSADGAAKVNDGAFLRLGGADAQPDAASVQRRREDAAVRRAGGCRPRSPGASRSRR